MCLMCSLSLYNDKQEERKTLNQELARAKISANRVATVVANAGKDGNDKVMPVKQWLEERRVLHVSFWIHFHFFVRGDKLNFDLGNGFVRKSLFFLRVDYFLLQGEMQQLRDKLAIAERAARSEAQLKVNHLISSYLLYFTFVVLVFLCLKFFHFVFGLVIVFSGEVSITTKSLGR